MKASIKTVTFEVDSEATLARTKVLFIESKNYTEQDLPLWGVEQAPTGFTIADIYLLWGLVDESAIDNPSIVTTRAKELYLPAANHDLSLGYFYDRFAGGAAFSAVWNSLCK